MHAYAALITVPSELACLRLITAPLFQTGSRVLPGEAETHNPSTVPARKHE